MSILYNLFIYLYLMSIHLAQYVVPKARRWVQGRRGWAEQLEKVLRETRKPDQAVVWMHCASLGEFEQGRPLLERLKADYPGFFILLTFYSPSGYEIRKNYAHADYICYLPADTPRNVRRFLNTVSPDLVVFVKYEFWFNFLRSLRIRQIPCVLISARFRPDQLFFRWYGKWFKKQLGAFRMLFTQGHEDSSLLAAQGLPFQVSGDTRVDRVLDLAAHKQTFPIVEAFCAEKPTLIAGSTWPPDEQMLSALTHLPTFKGWKLLIAPHDIQEYRLQQIERDFPGIVRYSQCSKQDASTANILLIDNIGMLSSLYQYGTIAWIGGAFGSGLHNTLEPIVFGLPVLFGPKYHKFREATLLLQSGGAKTVADHAEANQAWVEWQQEAALKRASEAALSYIDAHKGATTLILNWIAATLSHLSARGILNSYKDSTSH